MHLSSHDQRLLQRFRDGEMSSEESAAFKARLETEQAPEAELFRSGLAELEELSRGFVAGQATAFAAPAGFTASLLAEVRQLPSRIQLQQAEISGAALRLCHRVLIAAAILFGLGLCWHAGLFPDGHSDLLEAGPAEVQKEMDRLDAIIFGWDTPEGSGTAENRGR